MSFRVSDEWVEESRVLSEMGTFSDTYNYSFGYALNENEWLEENRRVTYASNYTYYLNTTLTGDFSMSMDIDAYRVDVSFGKSASVIWLAIKNGTYEVNYNLDEIKQEQEFINEYTKRSENTYNKYNFKTGTLIDSWEDIYDETGK